jgi:hypothetical protein
VTIEVPIQHHEAEDNHEEQHQNFPQSQDIVPSKPYM